MPCRRPPRIRGFAYIGRYAYFLTICAHDRHLAFTDANCADRVWQQLLRTAAAYRFAIIAYCLMPDHLHALIEGLTSTSDFRRFVAMFKQRSAFEYRHTRQRRLWQDGYYEHTLRDDDSRLRVAAYIVNNPIRAGLCAAVDEYPFAGSDRYTITELCEAIQTRP